MLIFFFFNDSPVDVVQDLRLKLDKDVESFVTVLHHSKIFDKVDYRILVSKLSRQFDFFESAYTIIVSYLINRSLLVYFNGHSSGTLSVT